MRQIRFDAVRAWVFDAALPLWAERGVDSRHGGFLEELGPSGEDTGCAFTRVRVLCRQIYVFSHASELGWPEGERLSAQGFDHLLAKASLGEGRWAKTLSRRGEVIDPTADLYEFAFVIFAAAWRFKISGEARGRDAALSTLTFVRNHMRAPDGGFAPRLPFTGERLQNPHMHLAEACLLAFEVFGDDVFLETAREVLGLLSDRFFDGFTLGEAFDRDWGRTSAAIEPGHQFEWAWILARYQRITGEDYSALAVAITKFAEQHGVDPKSGAVYDAVAADSRILRASSRIWTHTERLKAELALFELTGADPRPVLASTLEVIFERYFKDQIPGLWIDQFDGVGAPMTTAVPASCVYHLMLAFTELLRLEPKIRALPS